MFQDVDRREESGDLGTSVKILMEEEMSGVQRSKKTPKVDTEQIRHNEIGHEKNHRKTKEISVLPCNLHLNDKSSVRVHDKSNNVSAIERFSYKLHLAAVLEKFCGDKHECQRLLMDLKSRTGSCPSQESGGSLLCDFLQQPDSQVVQDHSTLHKVLIEIAEVLINQDAKAILSETSHQLEELLNASDILSAREILLKLFQDPSLILLRCIQEIKNDQEGKSSKPESCELLEECHASSRQCEESVSHKTLQKKNVHNFFLKKDKLQEEKVSNGNDSAQPLNKIVVLKPTPPRNQNSSNAINPISSQSCDNLGPVADSEGIASHFSLKEIKRRLKNVIGDSKKGQHILSMDGILHRIPYESQSPGETGSLLKDGVQTMSKRKTSHSKEQTSQLSSNSKKKDNKLKLKETQSSITHEAAFQNQKMSIETTPTSGHTEHNFKQEARKHLVDLLNIVDGEANSPAMQISKPLGRILSLSDYNLSSPRLSPGREKETSLSPRQMRFSPLWQSKQENEIPLSPLREIIVDSPGIGTRRTLDQVCDSNDADTQIQNISGGEISEQEDISIREISSPKGCTEIVESLDTEHTQECNSSDVPSGDGPTTDAEETREEERPLSPRANSSEMSQTVTISTPTTPVTVLVPNIGSPDSIIEKPERPSPVSILEPLFTEEVSSPVDSTDRDVDFPAQPCHIHFEEYETSVLVPTRSGHEINRKTYLEDKESSFEYVRAVLEASGLIQDGLWERCHSSSPLLSPSLYDEVEYSSDEFPDDLRHLFDSINEVLEVIREKIVCCTPWVSFAKPSIQPILSGEYFFKEVWKSVDLLLLSESPHTLDQIVGKDMEVGTWMDVQPEFEGVGTDIGDAILVDIMEEILPEFLD
uniref:DUF4378 domain-containing protein n=1 Tax=Anthurium amnicola TaxID=1678845 RepID=A0A1D1YAT0_9ARAE